MAKRAEETVQKVVGLRYIGDGAYLPRVPARDLTAAEMEQYQALLDEARAAGTLEQLYQPVYEAQSEVSDG